MKPQHANTGESYMPHSSIPPLNSQADERMVEQASENQYRVEDNEELGSPAEIQRPRSALHSGDFREGSPHHGEQSPQPRFAEPSPSSPFPRLGTSPTTPWFGASVFQSNQRQSDLFASRNERERTLQTRSRAPSLGSFSSSYVLKAPTSPLVYQANNTDLDFSPRVDPAEPLEPLERANRRRTLPQRASDICTLRPLICGRLISAVHIPKAGTMGFSSLIIPHVDRLPRRIVSSLLLRRSRLRSEQGDLLLPRKSLQSLMHRWSGPTRSPSCVGECL